MEVYTFSVAEFEDVLDRTKVTLLRDLVRKGMIDFEEAEKYCATHTIIVRKTSIFRTISRAWSDKQDEVDKGSYMIVVNNGIPMEEDILPEDKPSEIKSEYGKVITFVPPTKK